MEDFVVRYAQRGAGPGGVEAVDDWEAYILELQEQLDRLCREPSPLMQRLHVCLSIVEAQTQIRIHRGTLPLTNEEFEQLLRAIRVVDNAEQADEALELRRSLIEAGYIAVPPRQRRARRRAERRP
ncbi:MAG TPA: hypothetical protein VHL09_07605 [Dehalococcoidia bacterium]|nr:hypothetical protein [Dehalococcoidia bacterium]